MLEKAETMPTMLENWCDNSVLLKYDRVPINYIGQPHGAANKSSAGFRSRFSLPDENFPFIKALSSDTTLVKF